MLKKIRGGLAITCRGRDEDRAEITAYNKAMIRRRMIVNGTVQGVGFRPFVYQLAQNEQVDGWVCNTGDGVLIEVEGPADALARFTRALSENAPPLARVTKVESAKIPATGERGFAIRQSDGGQGVRTTVPPDSSTCADCLKDIRDAKNRRYGYPFTNCTNCGPRFTIIRGIPYDRPATTMSGFLMCPACQAEYENPLDRRFHAQPNACPVCGPHLTLDGESPGDDAAIACAAEMLREGDILAIKGLGGYHLACDARNDEAVRTLRGRKGRGEKPFAVMCADLEEARRLCVIDEHTEAALNAPERPIVLAPARGDSQLSPMVAPGLRELGIFLPYTPLHSLLLAKSPPALVMTSGNLSEEPIAYRDDEARERLGRIADHFLAHDRPIHIACDDSVVRIVAGAPALIRRARGFVPRTVELARAFPQTMACGGDLKNTFCLIKDKTAVLSQHLGDLGNPATLEHYHHVLGHLQRFFEAEPRIIAHDMHPDYHSTRLGLALPGKKVAVQHHHAHIVSCMAEHHLEDQVIGFAFDGTGYGTDGKIWGGEVLIADARGFERVAHLAYTPLPGGEAAIKRPARIALAHLLHAFPGEEELAARLLPALGPEEVYVVQAQVERGINSPLTSSMGRLFDAVSALIGICGDVSYEGQAAMRLEAMAEISDRCYSIPLPEGDTIEIDTRQLIARIVEDLTRGVSASLIAGAFHAAIADLMLRLAQSFREKFGLHCMVLSGGVFQNSLLTELALERLNADGFSVYRQQSIPSNDGGLSLGQAVIAAAKEESACV